MELKWKKPIAEATKVNEIIGVTEEEVDKKVEDFKEKVHAGEITNNGELMEYAGKIANNTEEAIVYASIFTTVISSRRNPLEEMLEAMSNHSHDKDDE